MAYVSLCLCARYTTRDHLSMLTPRAHVCPVVLGEQYFGAHATDRPLLVTGVYSAYVIMPLIVLARVWQPIVFGPYGPAPKAQAAAIKGTAKAAHRQSASPKRGR